MLEVRRDRYNLMHPLEAKTWEEPAQTVEPHAFSDAVAEGDGVDPPRVALCYSLGL